MGISVHDTWATHITLKSLLIEKNRYYARVHYQLQDHFGFKPFMTNMSADIEITGGPNADK